LQNRLAPRVLSGYHGSRVRHAQARDHEERRRRREGYLVRTRRQNAAVHPDL